MEETVRKRKESSLKKYGVDNPAKSLSIKKKTRETCFAKYGVGAPTQNPKIRKKQIRTLRKHYGVDNPQKSSSIQDRRKKSIIKKYGVNHPLQNSAVKEKLINSCMMKYGLPNPAQHPAIKAKAKKTCMERYGEKSFAKTKLYQTKTKATNLKKYGTTHPLQNEQCKIRLKTCRKTSTYNNFILNSDRWEGKVELIENLDEYIRKSHFDKFKFQCKMCSYEFEDFITNGSIPRCPKCDPKEKGISDIETEFFTFIESIVDSTIERNRKDIIPPFEIDVFFPDKNIAIEFNGNYWHSEQAGKKYKNYHINKLRRCEENKIRLIHVFEDEWRLKKDIVKSKLIHLLSPNHTEKIHARKCQINMIQPKDKDSFLTENHIQGTDNSSVQIGAFFKNELVAVMTFGKNRTALGNSSKSNEYEMYRFCIKKRKHIPGIANRLIQFFIKQYNPKKITSYADRRWSATSAFYSKIGFQLKGITPPNYWYMKSYLVREHRFKFAKHTLQKKLKIFNPSLTEWENMKSNGYDRIWDCGNLKFEINI